MRAADSLIQKLRGSPLDILRLWPFKSHLPNRKAIGKEIVMTIPKALRGDCCLLLVLLATLVPAHAQRFDITPLVGGRYGGTLNLEQQGVSPNVEGHLASGIGFGVAGGIRFDAEDGEGLGLLEFRWMRQNTHVFLKQDPLVPTPYIVAPFRPAVTLDHFLGDVSYEWTLPDAPSFKPFATASLGAVRMSTPASSATRFEFGIGAGLKVFPKPHWGFRFYVEYLPIVMHAEVQRLVCTGGCVVALSGGVLNQFQMSFGPTFRF